MSRCRVCARIAIVFHLRINFGWFSKRRSTAVGSARTAEKNMNGEHRTGCWWWKQVTVTVRQRYLKRMRRRKVCENLINALKLLANQRIDTAVVIWSEVAGLCGFWDGSCERCVCGAGRMIKVFTQALGWVTIHEKFGPVPGRNSLDAEPSGCAMLMNNLCQWIDQICVSARC